MSNERIIGRHVIADIIGLPAYLLHDADSMMMVLENALRAEGFQILKTAVHRFQTRGRGFTGIILLAESHAAIHTYPEYDYLAMDIFACGSADPCRVVESIVAQLNPRSIRVQNFLRVVE